MWAHLKVSLFPLGFIRGRKMKLESEGARENVVSKICALDEQSTAAAELAFFLVSLCLPVFLFP